MKVFKKRPCPICGVVSSRLLMRFTPAQIRQANGSYRTDIIEPILNEYQEYLIYHQCQACGFVYFPYYWPDEVLTEVYTDAINHEHSQRKTSSGRKQNELLDQKRFILDCLSRVGGQPKKLTVIDYGCGWGDFLSVMAGPGIQTIGFETDQIKAAAARQAGQAIITEATQLDDIKGANVVVMNSVLEHLQDIKSVLQQIHSLLAPKGLLLVTVMDYRSCFLKRNRRLLMAGKLPLTKNLNPIEHVNVFSYELLKRALEDSGYDFITTAWSLKISRLTGWPLRWTNSLERVVRNTMSGRGLSVTSFFTPKI